MKSEEEKIIEVIDTLRPFLINDGGNIEFIKYEDNIVYDKDNSEEEGENVS